MFTRMLNNKPMFITALALLLLMQAVQAQTSAFIYQGKLTDGGTPASGSYDFQVKLFDTQALGTGTQHGTTLTLSNITVSGGVFALPVDFGPCPTCFNGATRFLEIAVKLTSGGTFTTLAPRQPITSTPYAIKSLNAAAADGLSVACINCITSSQIQSVSGSAVTGIIPVASIPAGSANYIQNQNASPQPTSNFNISGDGTAGGMLSANLLNATTQFNLGGNRILSNAGSSNLFVGVQAGTANTTGFDNAFFGPFAGQNSTGSANSFFGVSAGFNNTGNDNSFFGRSAGFTNTSGSSNSFFGVQAGRDNSTGNFNSFFGRAAGISTTGDYNSFFGAQAGSGVNTGNTNSFFGTFAGVSNTLGSGNAFFGDNAGASNTLGNFNAFFGRSAGINNKEGSANAFFGKDAGITNTTGTSNTAIGNFADVFFVNLDHATAIGAGAKVKASNLVQIGRSGVDQVAIGAFGTPDSPPIAVCINGLGVFTSCSSSLRYKTTVQPFRGGLALLQRLRPITFTWKESGLPDIGLAAEEVAEVDEQFIFRNPKGRIEGVRYTQLSVLFINAFKEQQAQIENQQTQIEQYRKQLTRQQAQITEQGVKLAHQQGEIDALKQLLCPAHPQAEVCQAARPKK